MTHDEILGRTLRQLLARPGTIILSWSPGQLTASLQQDNSTRHVEADGPLLLLQAMLGTLRLKPCVVCGDRKPLTAFARAGESEESRNPACLGCERDRSNSRRRRASGTLGDGGGDEAD